MSPVKILVVTVVHHPLDARIWHRQIGAMLDQGWSVSYAAPWSAFPAATPDFGNVLPIDLPRAVGRRRLSSMVKAREVLRTLGPQHDVVLLHDPELLLSTIGLDLPPVVWDVHEDVAAAVEVRGWIPPRVRRPAARMVRLVERWAEQRFHLLLADQAYASRFRRPHPVVLNTTQVAPAIGRAAVPDAHGQLRVVYLGSVTMERGAQELALVGAALRRSGAPVRLEVIGPAHGAAGPLMEQAAASGDLEWAGFLPNDRALRRLGGALAGLSLLHDEANFRPSMPTKLVEYLAHGVPVITTPLPVAADLVNRSNGGAIVPFGDVQAVVDTVLRWAQDPALARSLGQKGHTLVAREFDWDVISDEFLTVLRGIIQSPA
ncbi:glycosyltransferase family 4 protein [Ornithinimicrobium panacihumi]|uniref:glycosyltransferase family 4 protein n=1 Tax=Ornithinimicrobium panacihumi TaxID=2008449 RepID=UPI003F889CF6